jgi:hypothetical protein
MLSCSSRTAERRRSRASCTGPAGPRTAVRHVRSMMYEQPLTPSDERGWGGVSNISANGLGGGTPFGLRRKNFSSKPYKKVHFDYFWRYKSSKTLQCHYLRSQRILIELIICVAKNISSYGVVNESIDVESRLIRTKTYRSLPRGKYYIIITLLVMVSCNLESIIDAFCRSFVALSCQHDRGHYGSQCIIWLNDYSKSSPSLSICESIISPHSGSPSVDEWKCVSHWPQACTCLEIYGCVRKYVLGWQYMMSSYHLAQGQLE